jgi:hypothetical protein
MELLITSLFIIILALAFNCGMIKGKMIGYMECLENAKNEPLNENI